MNQNQIRTIGVMTSGGDSPGMNPCIRAVVRAGMANNLRVLGIVGGYEGLIHGTFRQMGPRDVGGILQRGGTVLQTARSQDFRTPKGQREAIRQMNNAEMDALVVIGGDGSLSGAKALADQGVSVVGIPASIDNDIYGTDMCIGVDTAMNTIVEAIDRLRDTASSHSRAFLVETMGRNCGYLAVLAGITAGAEMVLVPEIAVNVDELIKAVGEAYQRGKTHCIIVVAEGVTPKTEEISKLIINADLGFTTRVTILGHVQRGGSPTAYDRLLSSRFGVKAVEFLLNGQNNIMVGLNGKNISAVSLTDVVSRQRVLPMEYYEMARVLAQ